MNNGTIGRTAPDLKQRSAWAENTQLWSLERKKRHPGSPRGSGLKMKVTQGPGQKPKMLDYQ